MYMCVCVAYHISQYIPANVGKATISHPYLICFIPPIRDKLGDGVSYCFSALNRIQDWVTIYHVYIYVYIYTYIHRYRDTHDISPK